MKLQHPYTVEQEQALKVLADLLKKGRLCILGSGAYISPISPEFDIGILEESEWQQQGPFWRLSE